MTGMEESSREHVKRKSTKIIPNIEKFLTIKDLEDGADDDRRTNPPLDRPGVQREVQERTSSYQCSSETTTKTDRKDYQYRIYNSQENLLESAPVGEAMQFYRCSLKPLPLVPNSQGRRVIPFHHFINNDLEYLRDSPLGEISHWAKAKTVYALRPQGNQLVMSIQKDDQKGDDVPLTSQEGDFHRLKDPSFERRVEDLQLGVESYQKKLNLTKPDTYKSNLRRQDAYTTYSDPRGFIYENKDKKNRLMRIDDLKHVQRIGTIDDV
ncbi:hypothetical protein Tco_0977038 [Tanacetum coccineum]|uniref:Uncharacterized protein n=1 Tax=Tanacetum coccineum TaxID=301880 RepID=A0ABQ5EJ12_9ASTR